MKRFLIIIFSIISLNVSAFQVSQNSNTGYSRQEMYNEGYKIENLVKRTFTKESLGSAMSEVLSGNISQIDDPVVAALATGISQIVINYVEVDVDNIRYISPNVANTTINIKIPDVNKINQNYLETELIRRFQKETGYTAKQLENQILSESQQQQMGTKILEIAFNIIDEEISKIRTKQNIVKKYSFKKTGNEWILSGN